MSAKMIRGDAREAQKVSHPHAVQLSARLHRDMVGAIRKWLGTSEPQGTYIVDLQRTSPEYRIAYLFSDYGTAFAFKLRFL